MFISTIVVKSGRYSGAERKNHDHRTWPHRRGSDVESGRYAAVWTESNSGQSGATSFYTVKVKKMEKKWRSGEEVADMKMIVIYIHLFMSKTSKSYRKQRIGQENHEN